MLLKVAPKTEVWKNMTYSHYSIHTTTPILEIRVELGMYPTYIPATIRLTKYLAYLMDSSNPIIQKAVITQKIQIYLVVKRVETPFRFPHNWEHNFLQQH